jgi:hypothetical protein
MKRIIKLVNIFVFSLSIASCDTGSEKENKKAEKPLREGNGDPQDSGVQASCESSNIVSILGRGRSIVSRSLSRNNSYQVWSMASRKLIGTINYIKNFHSISNNANFYLREITPNYFQLQAVKSNVHYIEGLRFSGPVSKVEFSDNSEFILSMYKQKHSRSNRLVIFDIRGRELIYGRNFQNLQFSKLSNEENLLVVTSSRGANNQLLLINPLLRSERKINLSSGKVHSVTQLKNRIIVSVGRKIDVYSTRTLRREFSYSRKILFASDYGANLMLVTSSDRKEFSLIDIRRNETITRFRSPEELLASTCKINHMAKELVCKSAIDPNKVIKYDYLKNEIEEICL